MNILIVPSWYKSDSNFIRGSFFKEQAEALARHGHRIFVAYVYMRSSRELVTKNLYKIVETVENDVKTYYYNIPSFGSMHLGNWFQRNTKAYDKLLEYVLRNEKIDIIHAHSFIPAGYAITELKKKYKIPVVVTEHFSGILTDDLSTDRKDALKKTIVNADKLIAVSYALRNAMLQYALSDSNGTSRDNTDIQVIPNILSNLFCLNSAEDKADVCNRETFRIISVGGLIPRKRHELTIKAFHEIFGKRCSSTTSHKFSLDIIGEGPEKENLEKLIMECGEKDRIKLVGLKDRPYVALEMQKSDLFVLPSAFETFGVVYIEAMAAGLPVIGTHNGGFDEIFDPEYGYIVPVDDIEAIKVAMSNAYQNSMKFNRKKISEDTIGKYGEHRIVVMLEQVYRDVLNKN